MVQTLSLNLAPELDDLTWTKSWQYPHATSRQPDIEGAFSRLAVPHTPTIRQAIRRPANAGDAAAGQHEKWTGDRAGHDLLLVPEEPSASTAFFKFQVQKTNEVEEARAAALDYLAAEYFQLPELFSDEMTAVFAAGSPSAASLLRAKDVLLDFEQYSQRFSIACTVRSLRPAEPAREVVVLAGALIQSSCAAGRESAGLQARLEAGNGRSDAASRAGAARQSRERRLLTIWIECVLPAARPSRKPQSR